MPEMVMAGLDHNSKDGHHDPAILLRFSIDGRRRLRATSKGGCEVNSIAPANVVNISRFHMEETDLLMRLIAG